MSNPLFHLIPLSGHSMYPTLKQGDLLYVLERNKEMLKKGDIVAFFDRHTKELTTHRLISTYPHFQTKGDNAREFDTHHSAEVLGVVVGYSRQHKRLFWGEKGQPLKKPLVLVSRFYHVKHRRSVRGLSKATFFLLQKFSALFEKLSSRNHNEKLLTSDPLGDA